MGRKISISQLSAAVMEQLNEYAELATEDMKDAVKKAGTAVRKDIEAGSTIILSVSYYRYIRHKKNR